MAEKKKARVKLANGDGKRNCPECAVGVRQERTQRRGNVMVVYAVCPVCEAGYRWEREPAEDEGLIDCPECAGKCKAHGRVMIGTEWKHLVHCRHCGRNFRVSGPKAAEVVG